MTTRSLTPPALILPPGITIPTDKVLKILLARPPATVSSPTLLYRAVWNEKNVWPHCVTKTHRFGPPMDTFGTDGTPPFHWMYAADHAMTAVLESRFTLASSREPNRFYIDPSARKLGRIATIDVARDLRLLDLTAETAGLAGLYDVLSSPDYQACQWIGYRLHQLGFFDGTNLDGILYPSRIRRNATAIAISSTRIADVKASATVSLAMFLGSAEYRLLMKDKLRIKGP